MIEQEVYMNSGTRMFTFAMMGNELVTVIYDSRWLLATILLCVIADFRFGWGESSKRYNRAKEKGDKLVKGRGRKDNPYRGRAHRNQQVLQRLQQQDCRVPEGGSRQGKRA